MTWQRGESWHTPNFGKSGEYGIKGLARYSNKTYDKNHHIADFTKITNSARCYKKGLAKIGTRWQKWQKRFGENDKKTTRQNRYIDNEK